MTAAPREAIDIVGAAAFEPVVACPAVEVVVPAKAQQQIVVFAANKRVVARIACEDPAARFGRLRQGDESGCAPDRPVGEFDRLHAHRLGSCLA